MMVKPQSVHLVNAPTFTHLLIHHQGTFQTLVVTPPRLQAKAFTCQVIALLI